MSCKVTLPLLSLLLNPLTGTPYAGGSTPWDSYTFKGFFDPFNLQPNPDLILRVTARSIEGNERTRRLVHRRNRPHRIWSKLLRFLQL